MALGGSTNAVLHLLAIARRSRGAALARRLRPHQPEGPAPGRRPPRRPVRDERPGQGGRVPTTRKLDGLGLIHTDALTASTETWAEALSRIDLPAPDGEVIRAATEPLHPWGGLVILRGSLARRAPW